MHGTIAPVAPGQAAGERAGERAAIRSLQPELGEASDDQIARVTALVDRLAERGGADELVAPLRPRLAQLNVPRRVNFSRLLFTPLDALIVPAPRWRAGQPSVPRTALAPLSRLVRAAMGAAADGIDAALAASAPSDGIRLARTGGLLWPVAAQFIARAEMPPDWVKSGLPPSVFASIAAGVAGVLRQAVTLHAIAVRPNEATGERIEHILLAATASGAEVRTMVTILLLTHTSRPDLVLGHDRETSARAPADRLASDSAVDLVIDGMARRCDVSGPIAKADAAEAAREAGRLADLLDGLNSRAAAPDRRRRLEKVRVAVEAVCRARFDEGLGRSVLDDLAHPEADIATLERAARDLRRLEQAARRVGGAGHYDKALTDAAKTIRDGHGADARPLGERVRVVELLAGPEEAMAMLGTVGLPAP